MSHIDIVLEAIKLSGFNPLLAWSGHNQQAAGVGALGEGAFTTPQGTHGPSTA